MEHGGGSASKRSIIRSPLELLADDRTPPPKSSLAFSPASPQSKHASLEQASKQPQHPATEITDPIRKGGEQRRAQNSAVIKVTDTKRNTNAVVPFGSHDVVERRSLSAVTYSDNDDHDGYGAAHGGSNREVEIQDSFSSAYTTMQEPSALVFMSPAAKTASEPTTRRRGTSGSTNGPKSHASKGSDVSDIPPRGFMTVDDAHAMVREALESYEQKRDEEEASVLERVSNEVDEVHRSNAALIEANEVLEQDKTQLRQLVNKLEAQCSMLTTTAKALHDELQQERERCNQFELKACHADDARRTAQLEHERDVSFSKAQWMAQFDEMSSANAKLAAEFAQEREKLMYELHELRVEATECTTKLESRSRQCAALEKRVHELETTEKRIDALTKTVEEKEAALAKLTSRNTALERIAHTHEHNGKRDEIVLNERIKSLEEAVRSQTDELRRKMFRLQQQEQEIHQNEKDLAQCQEEIGELRERVGLVHGAAETLWQTLNRGVQRKRPHKTLLRHDDATTTSQDDRRMEDNDDDMLTCSSLSDSSLDNDDAKRNSNKKKGALARSSSQPSSAPRSMTKPQALRTSAKRSAAPTEHHTTGRRRSASTPPAHSKSPSARHQENRCDGGDIKHRQPRGTHKLPNTLRILTASHEKIHDLLRRLHSGSTEVSDAARVVKDQLSASQKCLDSLKEKERQQDAERLRLTTECERLTRRCASLAAESREHQDLVEKLEYEVKQWKGKSLNGEEVISKLRFDMDEVRADRDARASQVLHLEEKLRMEQVVLESMRQQIRELEGKLDVVLKEASKKGKDLDDAEKLAAARAREAADLTQNIEKFRRQVTKLHAELATVRTEWNKTSDDLQETQAKYAKSEQALLGLRKTRSQQLSVAALEKRVEDVARRNTELEKLLDDQQKELLRRKEAFDASDSQLQEKLGTYRARVLKLAQELALVEDVTTKLISSLESEMMSKNKRLSGEVLESAKQEAIDARTPPRSSGRPCATDNSSTTIPLSPDDNVAKVPFRIQAAVSARSHPSSGLLAAVSQPLTALSASVLDTSGTSPASKEAASGVLANVVPRLLRLEQEWNTSLDLWRRCVEQKHETIASLQQTVLFLETEAQCMMSATKSARRQRSSAQTSPPSCAPTSSRQLYTIVDEKKCEPNFEEIPIDIKRSSPQLQAFVAVSPSVANEYSAVSISPSSLRASLSPAPNEPKGSPRVLEQVDATPSYSRQRSQTTTTITDAASPSVSCFATNTALQPQYPQLRQTGVTLHSPPSLAMKPLRQYEASASPPATIPVTMAPPPLTVINSVLSPQTVAPKTYFHHDDMTDAPSRSRPSSGGGGLSGSRSVDGESASPLRPPSLGGPNRISLRAAPSTFSVIGTEGILQRASSSRRREAAAPKSFLAAVALA